MVGAVVVGFGEVNELGRLDHLVELVSSSSSSAAAFFFFFFFITVDLHYNCLWFLHREREREIGFERVEEKRSVFWVEGVAGTLLVWFGLLDSWLWEIGIPRRRGRRVLNFLWGSSRWRFGQVGKRNGIFMGVFVISPLFWIAPTPILPDLLAGRPTSLLCQVLHYKPKPKPKPSSFFFFFRFSIFSSYAIYRMMICILTLKAFD